MKQIRFLLEDKEYKEVMIDKGRLSWREWVVTKARGGLNEMGQEAD